MKTIVWKRFRWLRKNNLNISLWSYSKFILDLLFVSLILNACAAATTAPYIANNSMLLETQVLITEPPCEACAQATLAVILTREKGSADFQAAATAEILRVNAQATLNSAVATLSAAQTQEQNNSNVIAAQIAATAEIVRANAQATLNSAGSTQIAAMTQAQYNLQATDSARTQGVIAMQTQQNKDDLAAGTQTAIANTIATQTQSAAATSQWYADQERQRDEEWRGSMTLFWIWCPLVFFVALTVSALWGFRRWLNIQQTNQRILENTVKRLPEAAVEVEPYTYIDSDVLDEGGYQVTTPEDKVHQWLDEVKDELSNSDEKEENNDQRN